MKPFRMLQRYCITDTIVYIYNRLALYNICEYADCVTLANEGNWFIWISSGRMYCISSDLLSFTVAASEFEQCFILLYMSFLSCLVLTECQTWTTNEGSAHFNVVLEFSLLLLGFICNENVPRKSVDILICVFFKLRCNDFHSVILLKENR